MMIYSGILGKLLIVILCQEKFSVLIYFIIIKFIYSFHEMGIYDLPAVINFITNLKQANLIYIGHSMGTTMGYIMGTERPQIANKVQLMISFAPVAFMKHIKSPVRIIAPYTRNIEVSVRFKYFSKAAMENRKKHKLS